MKEGSGLPPLPMLSTSQGRIVDFAKLYQRSNDEEVYESMQDIAEELERIASIRRTERETHQGEVLVYAPDQLTQLLTTKEASNNEGIVSTVMTKPSTRSEKGKPMRRFLTTSTSPFLASTDGSHTRHITRVDEDDKIYVKVQQIAWEDDIIWGFDIGGHSAKAPETNSMIEQDEDEGDQHKRTVPPISRHGSSSTSTQAPISKNLPRRESTTDIPYIPTLESTVFDMMKPRHYRWELEDESSTKLSKRSDPIPVLPCPLNTELEHGTWNDAIGWNRTLDMPESRLILDANDRSLIFSIPEMEDSRPTLRIPERKLGAAEIRLEQLDKQRREKKERIDAVMGKLDFGEETAEGRLGTDGSGKKNKDTRVVKNIGFVHHSLPAIKLSLTKPELPKAKLREFHRPRSKFKINERMTLMTPPTIPTKEEGTVITQIKKSSDLNPTAGGKLVMIEYTEQHPPMLSNPGMASRILHYWRPPDQVEDEQGNKKKLKKTRPKPPDVEMGQVITLGDHDESPFVGDVPSGSMITSLNSKLYKVPIFKHQYVPPFGLTTSSRENRESELFLLCRCVSKSKKGGIQEPKTILYMFEMPLLYIAGQIEPQIEVPAPNSRSANEFIRPYMSFHILRLFKKASDGERLKIEDIARAFPNQSGTAIRKRMKEVATFERGGNDSGWWKKKPLSLLQNEEEIRASIPVESVCLYESMMAGHRRLLDIGLTKLFFPTGIQTAINVLIKRLQTRKEQLSNGLVSSNLERRVKEKMEQEIWKRDRMIHQLEIDIQVARYIHEQLQLTPWNLTNNYVECHLQGKGSGMLLLGGVGDPTGRGEGFSFVRVPQTRAKKSEEETIAQSATTDATAVQKAVAAVTGTTADLRKLKMKEAGDVLRNLGVPEADIKKLRRWDRIHMVRELSSLATAHGRAGALSKFARGARKSLSAQQQEYRKKCDVIYERQMNVLTTTRMTFSSDEESSDDADILEELENDLIGTNGTFGTTNQDTRVKLGPKNLFSKGGGGLNRSKEALAEREDAVELERMRRELNEPSMTSTSTTTTSTKRSETDTNRSEPRNVTTPSDSRASSPTREVNRKKVLKRTIRMVEEDGSETIRIEFIMDEKQIARYLAKQQRQERCLQSDERHQLRKRKRLLALEDDSSHSLLDKAKKRKQLQEELKQLQKTEEQNKGYVEMLEKGETHEEEEMQGSIRCTQCGQLGHMRTNRMCPLYLADDSQPKEIPMEKLTLNLSELRAGVRQHQAEKKRKRLQEEKEQAELYKRPYMNTVVKQSRSRMPVSHLNSNLDVVIDKLVEMPESELFRMPVDATSVKDYYLIIKQPMDLSTMKQKTKDQLYDSMREFIKDMELIVNNSKMYNGDPTRSLITANATKLLKRAQEELATLHADGGIPS